MQSQRIPQTTLGLDPEHLRGPLGWLRDIPETVFRRILELERHRLKRQTKKRQNNGEHTFGTRAEDDGQNHRRWIYLLQTQLQHLGIVLGNLGVIDHGLDQFLLTGQSAVMRYIWHRVLMAWGIGCGDLETGGADKDALSSLLGRYCASAIRFAFEK